jgi:hypothetical protein
MNGLVNTNGKNDPLIMVFALSTIFADQYEEYE